MKFTLAFVACAGVLLLAAPADAQQPRPERPYRGLFGGGVGDAEQSLTLNVQLAGGYDDNVFADQGVGGGGVPSPSIPPGGVSQGGSYGQLSSGLTYSLVRTRVSMGASAGLVSRRYSGALDDLVNAYNGSVGATWRPSPRTALSVTQTASYQPFLSLQLFPQVFEPPVGQVGAPTLDFDAAREGPAFDTTRQEYVSYDTTVDLSAPVGRRGGLGIGYQRRFSDFGDVDEGLTTNGGFFRYTHNLAKGLGARLGYGYTKGVYAEAAEDRALDAHTIDVGVDFNRALSFSRRTTFSFATGTSALSDSQRTVYRLTGNANLNHEIGRTWNAGISYARGLEFVQRFSAPLFTDNVSVSFGGMVNRRLQFRSSVGAAMGSIGFTEEANRFTTYFANVGPSFALTRYLGLGADYFYYRYAFDNTTLLPDGVARELDRHGVRAYISLWAPLVQRARRPDASR